MDFGWVWERFWEAKIDDFRSFFDVFSMSFFKQKSTKNRMIFGTSILKAFWEGFGRVLGGFWEAKKGKRKEKERKKREKKRKKRE